MKVFDLFLRKAILITALISQQCIQLKMVKAIPEGYHSIAPYLVVNIEGAAIHFYKCAFEARETYRHRSPDGKMQS